MTNRAWKMMLAAMALAGALSLPLQGLHAQPQPTLADEMAAAVPQLREMLPKPVDEITTWTGISSRGTEFVYEMSVNVAVPPAQIAALGPALQQANQTRLCADAEAGALIRRGASMRHFYTDQSGNRFETRVASCPPAAAN